MIIIIFLLNIRKVAGEWEGSELGRKKEEEKMKKRMTGGRDKKNNATLLASE